jgi:hypothetical protein
MSRRFPTQSLWESFAYRLILILLIEPTNSRGRRAILWLPRKKTYELFLSTVSCIRAHHLYDISPPCKNVRLPQEAGANVASMVMIDDNNVEIRRMLHPWGFTSCRTRRIGQ